MTSSTELWQARTVSNLRKDQIIRAELDAARAEVERLAAALVEAQRQASDRDDLADEVARLTTDNAELRTMCEIVERIIGERDRARDLAVRAGAFEGDRGLLIIGQLQEDVDTLCSELDIMQRERDQAIYERDTFAEAFNG